MIAIARKCYHWSRLHVSQWWGNPWIQWSIRVGVSLIALSYVGWRLWREKDTLALSSEWLQRPVWLTVACMLLPLNLALEAAKWRSLLRSNGLQCTWQQASRAILAGAATGIFTPNRVGDYAGRLIHLPSGHRLLAAIYTFVCRIGQMSITVLLGLAGLLTVYQWGILPTWISRAPIIWIGVPGSLAAIGIWGFVWPQHIHDLLRRIPLTFTLLQRTREALTSLSPSVLRAVWTMSLLRGLVFVAQYAMLLLAFGGNVAWPLSMALVSIILLLKSLAPSVALAELGVRESVALAVMDVTGVAAPVVVAATFGLFLLNLIVPAMLGMLVISGRE